MKTVKYAGIIILLFSLVAANGVAENGDDTEKWVLVNRGNGIVSYGKLSSQKSVKQVYAVGLVEASIPVIEALLRDVPAHREYVHMVSDAYKVSLPGRQNTVDYFHEYCRLGMPWPVMDRDAVGECRFLIDKATGTLYVKIRGVKTDYRSKKEAIRMPVTDLSFTLVPKGNNSTEVTYSIAADPSIALPSFVLNMLFKTLGYKTIENMRDMVKKEKYRSATACITTTPLDAK